MGRRAPARLSPSWLRRRRPPLPPCGPGPERAAGVFRQGGCRSAEWYVWQSVRYKPGVVCHDLPYSPVERAGAPGDRQPGLR
ncbi:hypothetical protein caldi_07390 [Caldinitratiruptor microaerophilus]|uniref:Uncharacterized protein n=1 Tax=Caldinitratiruptor microaerophilus TaxID=671077 RepID=A0AA35CJJ9_9FIRM|nr:hypothetical protein caldi_07390 [Caldinitratiruptor microaerophilus]